MKKINKGKSLSRLQLVCKLSALGAMGLAGSVHAAEPFAADSPWMTGDWGGKRTELLDKGYDFSLEYVSEMASNLKGGYNDDTTGRYSDQFALGMKSICRKFSAGRTQSSSWQSPNVAVATSPMTVSAILAPVHSAPPRKSGAVVRPGA